MAKQKNNPGELADEDWAMSEPEIPVKREIQADQEGEVVASLYDPLETGDLEGWDISSADTAMRIEAEAAPGNAEVQFPAVTRPAPTREAEIPFAFSAPQHSFEVLKPVPPPSAGSEDWGIDPSKTAGSGEWKMPDPVFRVSEGRNAIGSGHQTGFAEEPVAENLVEIYKPPDTHETVETESIEFGGTEPDPIEQFEFAEEIVTEAVPNEPAAPQKKRGSGKRWIFIGLGILAIGVVAGLITIAAFGLIVFKSK